MLYCITHDEFYVKNFQEDDFCVFFFPWQMPKIPLPDQRCCLQKKKFFFGSWPSKDLCLCALSFSHFTHCKLFVQDYQYEK
jgi:hypothetical protein